MQWIPAPPADYRLCLMDATLMALLLNSKQCTVLPGQQYVSVELLLIQTFIVVECHVRFDI